MNQQESSIIKWERDRQRPVVESLFLKITIPDTKLAVWLRYTITKTRSLAHGALWAVLTDAKETRAVRQAFPMDQVIFSRRRFFLRIGKAKISTGRAVGEVADGQNRLLWDLGFETPAPFFRHFPMDILYRMPFPEVKLVSPYVSTLFYGTLTLNGSRIELNGAPGMIGHNWTNKTFPHEWLWIHCNRFKQGQDTVLEIAASRLRPKLPFIAVGFLRTRGQETLFNSPLSILHNRVNRDGDSIRISLQNHEQRVEATIRNPDLPPVQLCYVAPDDSTGLCLNSPGANIQLALYNEQAYRQGPYMAIRSDNCTVESMISGTCNDCVLDDRIGR